MPHHHKALRHAGPALQFRGTAGRGKKRRREEEGRREKGKWNCAKWNGWDWIGLDYLDYLDYLSGLSYATLALWGVALYGAAVHTFSRASSRYVSRLRLRGVMWNRESEPVHDSSPRDKLKKVFGISHMDDVETPVRKNLGKKGKNENNTKTW